MATPGTTFRELIRHATSKEGATKEDFESAMSARGYKPGDVRKLGNAFERVNTSGNEYVLHPEKGFNVFGADNTQKTGSGKKKGNKAGLDLGDFIGLGNDVSILAGALRNEVSGYEKAKVASQKAATPEAPTPVSVSKELTGAPAIKVGAKTTPIKKTTGSGSKKPGEYKPNVDLTAPTPEQGGGLKTWEDFKNSFGKMGQTAQKTTVNPETGKPEPQEEGSFRWDKLLLGDLSLLYDVENYKDLAAAWNPMQIWDPGVRAWSKNRMTKNYARNKSQWESEHPGDEYDKRVMGTEGMGNFGLLTPVPGRTGAQGIQGFFKKAGSIPWGKTAAQLSEELRNITSSGGSDAAKAMRFQDVSNQLKKFQKVAPSAESIESNFFNNMTEDLEHLPQKKGGKLIGASGIKLKDPYNDLYDQSEFFSLDPSTRGLSEARQYGDVFPPEAATQTETPIYQGAEYDERAITPAGARGTAPASGFRSGDMLAGLVKYGVPAAYLAAEQAQIHNLRGKMNPHLVSPDLMVGSVQDLPSPDFTLPYDPRMGGSSLAEAQNLGLQRARISRQGRNDFQLRNALNRQGQRDQVISRLNQSAGIKASTANQEEFARASNAASEFGYLLGDRERTAGSLFQNVDQGIYGAQVTRDARSLSQAQDVIRNPERYTEQDVTWARQILGRRRKSGGKMKYSKPC